MKLRRLGQAGFTIIEVVLFLAISTLMVAVAMNQVAGRTQQVQYEDSTRALETFFERRISQVLEGSIIAESQDCVYNDVGGYQVATPNGSCVFLGYLFHLDPATPNEVDVLQVYGRTLSSTDPCLVANPTDPLFCAEPHTAPVAGGGARTVVETFQIPWAAEIFQKRLGGGDFEYFGYLRHPAGHNLIPVGFLDGNEGAIDTADAYREGDPRTLIEEEFEADICLELGAGGLRSQITFGFNDRQFDVDAVFNDNTC